MASDWLVEQLLTLSGSNQQREFLQANLSLLNDRHPELLKEQVIQSMRTDIHRALQLADLILYLADLTRNSLHRAIGLRAKAQARAIGLGDYQHALELYDEAAAICRAEGDELGQAHIEVTRVYSLACLGRYDEAFRAGDWARGVLETHGRWRSLATLTMNLALIHGRQGKDTRSLAMLDEACRAYRQLGAEGEPFLAQAQHNRAIVLRNLGQFDEALTAGQRALEMHHRLEQWAEAARTEQNLAITCFILGQYNEALERLDRAREFFSQDGRDRDAILAELFISDCLLQLRRFSDVLDKCRRVRHLFSELGTRFEVAQAILNEATAYAGLTRYEAALTSLAEARRLFEAEGNQVWLASSDLEKAIILQRQGRYEASLMTAQSCADIFHAHNQPLAEAQARLVAARAAISLQQHERASLLVREVLELADHQRVPTLLYHARHLLGKLALAREQPAEAMQEYDQAIEALERLRGRLMVEFRADFLEDKQVVYEEMVALCLDLQQPDRGLEYAERAKSRALLDLLAYRLDLSLHARHEGDRPLIDELMELRRERDQRYRRWIGDEELAVRGRMWPDESQEKIQQEVLALEKRITELWYTLLIRNADYARDAALWQVRAEPIQPYLDEESALLEFFTVHDELVLFLVTTDEVRALRLSLPMSKIQQLLRLFRLNLMAVPRSALDRIPGLTLNAQGLLHQLYMGLLEPLGNLLDRYSRLIIVPHGPLHYLPFHALYDGRAYLVERFEVSILPGASFLHYCKPIPNTDSALLAIGHSCENHLPFAVQEARTVASIWRGQALLEEEATLERVRARIPTCDILHLATHGEFRTDNPLFSGLLFTDGWLTTLDIFNLRLRASLVTLSACESGQNVIGGGDELLGLMRALLYAGTPSLLLSLWSVEDRSTAWFMECFYRHLAQGATKGSALCRTQQYFLRGQDGRGDSISEAYRHPYFWGAFFLVGHTGAL